VVQRPRRGPRHPNRRPGSIPATSTPSTGWRCCVGARPWPRATTNSARRRSHAWNGSRSVSSPASHHEPSVRR
jgi:hypothetical protein